MSEDPLTDFIGTLSNLPAEVRFVLSEVTAKDHKATELMSRIQARDTAIQKHFKALGLLTENPKEAQSVQKCRADFSRVESLTDDKIALAERMARLLQRHLAKLQIELGKLQGQPVPNIAARFGMRLPPEQISQSAFSPAALPGGPLMESSNKRRKTGLEPISVSRANSPAMPSSLSRASSSQMPSTSSSLAAPPSSSGGRKRKTPIPEEEDADAEGEVDASGSDDNDFGEQDAEGENDMPATGDDALYCVCQKVSYGEMVGCDNAACQYEWFHLPCVGLKEPPKGKWYCPDCSGGVTRLPSNPPVPPAAAAGPGGRPRSGRK